MNAIEAGKELNRPVSTENGEEGYLVEYKDGYMSWSPKKAFEETYSIMDGMTFGMAIESAKKGNKIARKGWNGKGIIVYIVASVGVDTRPYLVIDTTCLQSESKDAVKCIVPWVASQTDILSDDWEIVI